MSKPRRRVYVLLVLVLAGALVVEPLAAKEPVAGARVWHFDASTPFRAAGSALAAIPDALGSAVSGIGRFFSGMFGSSSATAAAPAPTVTPSPSAPSPDAPNEIVSMRNRDAKFFRNSNGTTRAEFAANQHYLAAPGRWEKVDLNFRSEGADRVVDRSDVIVRVTGNGINAIQRGSGKGMRWLLPETPTVSGREARFDGQGGLVWRYFATPSGLKLLSDPVASPVGVKTYTFAYQLLGQATAPTVDASGNLVSDVFTVPRPYVQGADDETYPASPWRLGPGSNEISFDLDDGTVPQTAYPYRIDPSTLFGVAVSGDDDFLVRTGTTYPPAGTITANPTNTRVGVAREKESGIQRIHVGFVRFNTASIPDTATINSATLSVYVTFVRNTNGLYLNASYYTAWPITTGASDGDYTSGVGTNASGSTNWPIPTSNGSKILNLSNVSNISKTSYTGFRFTLSQRSGNAAPTGENDVHFASWDATDYSNPRMTVVYNNTAPTVALDSPTNLAAVPSVTPVLKAIGSDPQGDAMDWQFQVDDTSDFSSLLASSGWLSRTSTWTVPPSKLKDGMNTIYWRAQSRDAYGATSAWSASQTFNVRVAKLGARDVWPMWSHGPVTVNQATGNLVLGVPGPAYPTAAGSMTASASYNLHNTANGDGLGVGWVLNVGEGLANPPSRLIDHSSLTGAARFDAVEMIFPDGSIDYYTHVGNTNTYQSAAGDSSRLQKNSDSPLTWTLLDEDGAIYSFLDSGTGGVANLTAGEVSDASPGQSKLSYGFSGSPLKIASITDTAGRAITFNWTCASTNALVCMTGPDGVAWKYIHDGSGRLSTVNNGTRDLLKITYDASGRPQKIQNANDLNPAAASPGYNGTHTVTIGYDTASPAKVLTVTEGPVTGQTPSSATWTLAYTVAATTTSASTNHGGARTADGYTTLTAPSASASSKVYFDNLRRTMETVDELGNKILVSYNDHDQVVWSEDAQGNPTDNTYDPINDVLLTSTGPDPDGTGTGLPRPVTTYRYDETAIGTSAAAGPALQGLQASYYPNKTLSGRPVLRRTDATVDFFWGTGTPSPDLPGDFSVRWNGLLNVPTTGDYTFTLEADDGVRLTIDTGSATVAPIDDWTPVAAIRVSQPITLSAGLHKITLDYYDNLIEAAVHLRWACDACGITEQVIPASALRPAWLNQTSTVEPAGRVSFHHYNDPPSGHEDYDLVQVGGQNLITSYTYDTTGRITQKVMPKGNASRPLSGGTLGGAADTNYATDWTYYGTTETASPPAACGGGTAVPQGGLVKTITPHGVATTTTVYDIAGQAIASTNGAGTTCSTYSSEGRLDSDKAPWESVATTYTYDPAGAQRTATNSMGTVTTEYDEAGRVKRSVDSFGAESTFLYDARSNRTRQTAAIGALSSNPNYVTNYTYNDADQLSSLTDPASRLYSFTYDTRGNLRTIQMPNGTFVWQDYNAAGWVTGLYNRHGTLPVPLPGTAPTDTNALSDYFYTYGVDGKKAQETRSGGGFTTQTTDYTYDALGRLATANLPDVNNNHTLRTYTYDLDSNRIEVKDGSTVIASGVYDLTNPASPGVDQLTSYTNQSGTKIYYYTADGQVSQRSTDTLSWDGRGRMSGGTFSGTLISYGFDAAGRMRSRTSGGTTTHFRHAGDAAIFDTSSAGVIQNTGVSGPAGDLTHYLGTPQIGTTAEFLYYTGHGDLAAKADAASVRTGTFTYDPFGVLLQTPPTNASVERWTGKWDKRLDTTSNLIQM